MTSLFNGARTLCEGRLVCEGFGGGTGVSTCSAQDYKAAESPRPVFNKSAT